LFGLNSDLALTADIEKNRHPSERLKVKDPWEGNPMKYFFNGLTCVIFSCAVVWAQSTAQISGSVADQSGAVLPGVDVTVTQTQTGFTRAAITNETGSYVLANLPIGPYKLEVALAGFRTYVQNGIVLAVSSNPVFNVKLDVGQVAETVEVQANAAMVETRTTGISQLIDNTRVLELPLNGRQVTELVLLSGAATTSTQGTLNPGSRNYPTIIIQVAGGMQAGVTYNLDGGNHNDPYNNLNLPLPFPDAMEEFKVETSGLAAQYGFHSSGAVNAVTKSGTNEFHGSAFEFLRNGALNARNAFDINNDGLKRNQFGGTFGGPILKKKLFFFGAHQHTTQRSRPSSSLAYIPTEATLSGDFTTIASAACNNGKQIALGAPFAGNKIDPAAFSNAALNLVHNKLFPTTTDPCGLVRFGSVPKTNEGLTTGRVDYQLSAKHSMFGRYLDARLDTPTDYDGENILTLTNGNQKQRAYSFVLSETYLVGPQTVNSFRGAVNRTVNEKRNPDYFDLTSLGVKNLYESVPNMTYLSVAAYFNIATSLVNPGHYNSTSFHIGDDLSIVRGPHQIGLGASWIHQNFNGSSGVARVPNPVFNGHFTGLGLADFLLGKPSSFVQGNATLSNTRQNSYALYIQDTWKALPRLTVSPGLRWEPHTAPYALGRPMHFEKEWFDQGVKSTVFRNAPAGLQYTGDPLSTGFDLDYSRLMKFAPRFGLAWDVEGNGRTTIRSAYGMFYDTPPMFHWGGNGAPWSNQVSLNDPVGGLEDPWQGYAGGNPFPTTISPDVVFPQSVFYITFKRHMQPAYVHQWNLSLQRQVGTDWMVAANYIGSSTIHGQSGTEANPSVFLPGASCMINGRSFTPCSSTGNTNQRRVLYLANPSEGQYFANITQLGDESTSNYNGLLLSVQRRRTKGVTVQANYTWSHCIGDVFIAGGNQTNAGDYPGRRGYSSGSCPGDLRHLFNMSTVYETPHFDNRALQLLASGWQVSGIVRLQSGGYFGITSGFNTSLGTGFGIDRANQVLADPYLPNRGIDGWLNPAAFSRPADGVWGNASLNIQGPGFIGINMGLTRKFRIHETQSLEFRAEAFNLPNHVNPNNPVTALNNQNFGKILSANDPRIIQLALKYLF
jgi:hypothetical protein